jgi:hypothetical protein
MIFSFAIPIQQAVLKNPYPSSTAIAVHQYPIKPGNPTPKGGIVLLK